MAALRPLLLALACVASAFAQVRTPIGVVSSDYPFLIEGEPVPHHGTLLEAEAVTSAFMPTRVVLNFGASYILGIGSQARFSRERVLLDGVSLEIVLAGTEPQPIEVAGIEIRASTTDTRAAIYSDRPEIVSVTVSRGSVEVSRGEKTVRSVSAGEAVTFSETRSSTTPRIQEKRSSLEIARIQMRQLQYLSIVEEERPAIGDIREGLIQALAMASGGLLGSEFQEDEENLSPVIPTGLPAVNPELLLRATEYVAAELRRSRLDLAGCGSPACATPAPPVARNDFSGIVGTLPPPYPGCTLCREREQLDEPAP